MGNSAARAFGDPDAYDSAIRAAEVVGHRASVARFQADLVRADLGRVWMQRFRENTARLMRIASTPSRSILLFRSARGSSVLRQRGHEVDGETLLFLGAGVVDPQFSDGPVDFGSVSISPADLAQFGSLLAERELAAPATTAALKPPPAALARLRFLHDAVARLATDNPGRLAHPEIARAFENAFTSAFVRCIADPNPALASLAGRQREALVRRMEERLARAAALPVYVAELCRDLGATERTLERACHDLLGMGPKQYLLLRRLRLARDALIETDASRSTVSEVALNFGFWQLGRFAGHYRNAFGETPMETLRRPSREARHSQAAPHPEPG